MKNFKLTVDLIRDWECDYGEDFFDQCEIRNSDRPKLFEFIKENYPEEFNKWNATFDGEERRWFLESVLHEFSYDEDDNYNEESRCKHYQIVCDYINQDQELLDMFIEFLEENSLYNDIEE